MPVRNQHWYNLNESRGYPLDDTASMLTDDKRLLPSHIITDLQVRYPEILGIYPFVSAVSVTPRLVTVTLQAANYTTKPSSTTAVFNPLAAISIDKSEIIEGRQIALQPQYPGVAGWITIGSGLEDYDWTGRFSEPSQTLIAPRAARTTKQLPVTSISKSGTDAHLTGVIKLFGSNPLKIVKESREIDGVEQDVIVLRLEQPSTGAAVSVTLDDSVFKQFAGPCSGRPESGTCSVDPIEFINSVGPDCNGLVTIEFQGCAEVAKILSECGVAIDCSLGLTEACMPPRIPSDTGQLPGDYDPIIIPSPIPSDPEPGDDDEPSLSLLVALPYEDCFGDQEADDFSVESGVWVFSGDDTDCPIESLSSCLYDSPDAEDPPLPWGDYSYSTENLASLSLRNLTVLDYGDNTTSNRRIRTDVKLLYGQTAALRNAGVVINYRDHQTLSGRKVYHYAEIDYDNQEFSLKHFNGSFMSDVLVQSLQGQIQLDRWYRFDIKTRAPSTASTDIGKVDLSITLSDSCDDSSLSVQIGPIPVSNYLPSDGLFGFSTNRSYARFSYVRVDEN